MASSRDTLFERKEKKMATSSKDTVSQEPPKKKRARHGSRLQMELKFDTEDAKKAFVERIDKIKRSLVTSACGPKRFVDNQELLSILMDNMEENMEETGIVPPCPEGVSVGSKEHVAQSMLDNSGLCKIYIL